MATAIDNKSRTYRLSAKDSFPANSFAVKCERFDLPPYFIKDRDENGKVIKVPRKRYRAIDIPTPRRYYEDDDDEVGQVVIGALHDLTDRELEFVKGQIDRYIVRWQGRYTPPKNKPHKTGNGPGGRFVSGRVIAVKTSEGEPDHNFAPASKREVDAGIKLDEPASNYISIVFASAVDAIDSGTAGIPAEHHGEMARLRAELEEAKRRLAEREAEEMEDAADDEREDLQTTEGKVTQAIQSHKKRRGRPPKQR